MATLWTKITNTEERKAFSNLPLLPSLCFAVLCCSALLFDPRKPLTCTMCITVRQDLPQVDNYLAKALRTNMGWCYSKPVKRGSGVNSSAWIIIFPRREWWEIESLRNLTTESSPCKGEGNAGKQQGWDLILHLLPVTAFRYCSSVVFQDSLTGQSGY